MNNKQLDALIRTGENVMVGIGDGLYFRIARKKPSWVVKYTIAGKRSQMALPTPYPSMTLSEAKAEAIRIRQDAKIGVDPKSERQKKKSVIIRTVDQLFEDWYQTNLIKHIKHPEIPARYYRKEMQKHIGVMNITDVKPVQIRNIIDEVIDSGRMSIANKTLLHAKQMFNHAIKLGLTTYNPAQAFTPKDAGGSEAQRERVLTIIELEYAFKQFRKQSFIFTRDNYLACCLLLSLGCRKGELISARWEDIDLENKIWSMQPNKKKKNQTNPHVDIPLTDLTIAWFKELKVRSAGSEYVFPARRSSQKGFISSDTLNHALAKMLGMKVDSKKEPNKNLLSEVEHFTIHDFRRTFRSLLSGLGVSLHVAERCLNHKLKGVVGVYDRHNYFSERKEALQKLSDYLAPVLDPNFIATEGNNEKI